MVGQTNGRFRAMTEALRTAAMGSEYDAGRGSVGVDCGTAASRSQSLKADSEDRGQSYHSSQNGTASTVAHSHGSFHVFELVGVVRKKVGNRQSVGVKDLLDMGRGEIIKVLVFERLEELACGFDQFLEV